MTPRTSLRLLAAVLLCSPLLFTEGVEGWGGLSPVPSESECRPYIEKALKEQVPSEASQELTGILENVLVVEAVDVSSSEAEGAPIKLADQEGSIEETDEANTKETTSDEIKTENLEASLESVETTESNEQAGESTAESGEITLSEEAVEEKVDSSEAQASSHEESVEEVKTEESSETGEVLTEEGAVNQSTEEDGKSIETGDYVETESTSAETQEDTTTAEEQSSEKPDESTSEGKSAEEDTQQSSEHESEIKESGEVGGEPKSEEVSQDVTASEESSTEVKPDETREISEETLSEAEKALEEAVSMEGNATDESEEVTGREVTDSVEEAEPSKDAKDSTETSETIEASPVEEVHESVEEKMSSTDASKEESAQTVEEASQEDSVNTNEKDASTLGEELEQVSDELAKDSIEAFGEAAPESIEQAQAESIEQAQAESIEQAQAESIVTNETAEVTAAEGQTTVEEESTGSGEKPATEQESPVETEIAKEQEPTVEDQLMLEFETPKVRRSREHIAEILKLNPESAETELLLAKTIETTLKDLKRLYDAAIKPLEIHYKYRDLSNRHFGDPEIFSKPLILFMGPWSGGKSTILNYLMDNEFKASSLRTGAEPSPAYFNLLMWGEREEVLDGTQLAADWTFSGLQKFGQGLLDRLRGLRLNNPLLEKVNIVEIPGILEIRKQVERLFPFNDACQWFIDRADIIFLVYDPSKLDVGPETEAILDQLKGREYQTRIILNKADQVKPEELMRVQGTLIWNISPLMSSMEPPVMYSTSLWSIPYEQGAPSRLLHAQERAFLRDLRTAIDKRVENKIASARRFAVRVRNHAKMVDCYLTTYYNHKTFFGNRKKVADEIIEHPQNYHIYEGLSTLTNISRYDLPDPEVYRDFFRLNPLYDFQRLSETCTFFRGCPINRLDVSIAYDLPELVGKYKKQAEKVLEQVADKQSKS